MRFTLFGIIRKSGHDRYGQRKGITIAKGIAECFHLLKDLIVHLFPPPICVSLLNNCVQGKSKPRL